LADAAEGPSPVEPRAPALSAVTPGDRQSRNDKKSIWLRAASALRRRILSCAVFAVRTIFFSTESGRRTFTWLTGTYAVRPLLVTSLALVDERRQRRLVRRMLSFMSPAAQGHLASDVMLWARRSGSKRLANAHGLILAYAPSLIASWDAFVNGVAQSDDHKSAQGLYTVATAAYELARYKDAVAAFLHVRDADPSALCDGYDYAKAAYAAGKIRNPELAMEFFARQFGTCYGRTPFDSQAKRIFLGTMFDRVSLAAMGTIARRQEGKDTPERIGVFFLSSTEALGHAILDPYYFLALRRSDYDRVVFIGPPRERYRSASAVCLKIVEQYGDYVESTDDFLLNLSWMSMGTASFGPLTFHFSPSSQVPVQPENGRADQLGFPPLDIVIEHYWSLLREAVHRSRDQQDQFRHNGWHMQLPAAFEDEGTAFSRQHGIDLKRPLVVVHARDHGYHKIEKQAFRNADVTNYLAALNYLLKAGYQVVRIGDRNMQRLDIASPDFHELPFMEGYSHMLDPFFISRSRFMIGCQSGPCSYARALGIPLLSINAVLHYTLLPAAREMACFKRYMRDEPGGTRELALMDALAAGVYHFDNSYQFRQAGIRMEDASSDEIIAAVKDMIAWLDNPELPETGLQVAFRDAVVDVAAGLQIKGMELDLPIGDFIGIALPGYRISPSVAAMRADRKQSGLAQTPRTA
jgi:putative glycosyltransferase (TIGR04372 family)